MEYETQLEDDIDDDCDCSCCGGDCDDDDDNDADDTDNQIHYRFMRCYQNCHHQQQRQYRNRPRCRLV